jgi:hypothetical protein
MTVEDLEKAVALLPPDQLAQFRVWFDEFISARFDQQIAHDARSGKLDRPAEQAIADLRKGRARELCGISPAPRSQRPTTSSPHTFARLPTRASCRRNKTIDARRFNSRRLDVSARHTWACAIARSLSKPMATGLVLDRVAGGLRRCARESVARPVGVG